jgi:hypothetical protein
MNNGHSTYQNLSAIKVTIIQTSFIGRTRIKLLPRLTVIKIRLAYLL